MNQGLKWKCSGVSLLIVVLAQVSYAQMGSISGTVTDDQGEPVACAAIVFEGPNNFRMSTTTDASGVYMLDGLEPGDYMVQVHAPGFELPEDAESKAPQRVVLPVNVEADQDSNQDFPDLTAREAGTLRAIQGLVLFDDSREPVPDCEMFVRTRDCELMDVTFTCRNGLYELVVPEELMEEITVSFQLPDFEPVPLAFTPEVDGITMADDILLTIFGDDVGSILGSVTDQDGNPINLAQVTVVPEAKQGGFETNCNGDFKVDGLEPGIYSVIVSAEGFLDSDATVEVVAGAEPTMAAFVLEQATDPLFDCPGMSALGASGNGIALGDWGSALTVWCAITLLFGSGLLRQRWT